MKKKKKLKKLGTLAIGATLAVSCVLSPIAAAEETTGETETTTISQEENTTVKNEVQTTASGMEETTTGQTEQETTTSDNAQTTEPETEENTTNQDTENAPDATQQLNKTDLQAKIDEALALIDSEPDCEDQLISDVQSCIALARAVIAEQSSTQEEIDEAYELLQNAMDIITGGPEIPPLTKDDLSALISQVQPYVSMSDRFTKDSFEYFIFIFTEAQAVLNDPMATEEDIMCVYGSLQIGYYCLITVEETDKSDLYTILWYAETSLEEIDTSWMQPESFDRVDNALKNAQKVLDDAAATQAQINSAVQELSEAMEIVEFTHEGCIAMAQHTIDKAESYIDGQLMYTPESWENYIYAKTALENVMANPNATQEDFLMAIGDYLGAVDYLNTTAENTSKKVLRDLINQAKQALNHSDYYTSDSVERLKEAYNYAQEVYKDNTVTGHLVQQAGMELSWTLDSLEFTQNGAKLLLRELKTQIDNMRSEGIYDQDYLESAIGFADKLENLFCDFEMNYETIKSWLYELQNMLSDIPYSLDYLYSVLDDYLARCEEIIAANKDYDMGGQAYYYYEYFLEIYNKVAAVRDSGYENENYDKILEYAQDFTTIFNTFSSMRDEAEQMLSQAKAAIANADKYTVESLTAVKAAIPALETVLKKDPNIILELRFAYEKMYAALHVLELRIKEPITKPSTNDTDNPKTGDDRNLFPIGLTGIVSLAVMGAMVLLKKKKAGENE